MSRAHEPSKRPTVWVVSDLYHPEDTSTGHYLTGIAEGLVERFDVAAICGQPGYAHRGTRALRRERRHGVRIFRCRATRFDKDRLALRALNWLTLAVSVVLTAVRRIQSGDVALVVTTPPTLPLVVMCVALVRRARYVVLVHDVYPDVLAVTGQLSRGCRSYQRLDRLFASVYRRAERVIVLGRDMRDLLVGHHPHIAPKTTVIPNWADVDLVTPLPRERNRFLRSLHIEERFVVQYAGNLGRTHAVEELIAAMDQIGADDLTLLVCGFGAKRAFVEQQRRTSAYLQLLERVPREQLSELLNACDVAVVPLKEGMTGVSVPSRIYNILAAGKPIIAVAENGSEIARLVDEERLGWVVPPGDVDGLAKAVVKARGQSNARAAIGHRARLVAERRFHPEEIRRRYAALFTEVVGIASTPRETWHRRTSPGPAGSRSLSE